MLAIAVKKSVWQMFIAGSFAKTLTYVSNEVSIASSSVGQKGKNGNARVAKQRSIERGNTTLKTGRIKILPRIPVRETEPK